MKTAPFIIAVDNLTARDAAFLSGVIKVLCDPDYEFVATMMRAGKVALAYGSATGHCLPLPINSTNAQAIPTLQLENDLLELKSKESYVRH